MTAATIGGFGVFLLSWDIHGGISKYPMLGFCHASFLGEGRISEFRCCGWVLRYWRAQALGLGQLHRRMWRRQHFWPWLISDRGGRGQFGSWCLWGWFWRFWGLVGGAFWGCAFSPFGLWFFTLWCFLGVVSRRPEADRTPLNDLSIVFQSPSGVKHCKVGTDTWRKGVTSAGAPWDHVLACGTCWFCVWSGVSCSWSSHLFREVSL